MISQSLNHYITTLLDNDKELEKFLHDPTNSEAEHGITKAERAVLRRVTSSLSNKSLNGYSIQRDLPSYRRSLRLLQNVLHKNVADHNAGFAMLDASANTGSTNPTVYIYVTGNAAGEPGAPYDNPAIAYTSYVTFQPNGTFGTIGEAMSFNPPTNPSINDTHPTSLGTVKDKYGNSGTLSYTSIFLDGANPSPEWFVLSFTLQGFPNGIDGTYTLPYKSGDKRQPFWYFSLNGQAISPNSSQGYYRETAGVIQGEGSKGFTTFDLSPSDTKIDWQPIAPDQAYGFGPCFKLPANIHQLGVSVPQTAAIHPGQVFYSKQINNITLPAAGKTITISSNSYGDGDLFTDDVLLVSFIDPSTSSVVYEFSHDFSGNCSGVVTPLPAQEISAHLQTYAGKQLNILTKYQDKCGGMISSLGYYLIFG